MSGSKLVASSSSSAAVAAADKQPRDAPIMATTILQDFALARSDESYLVTRAARLKELYPQPWFDSVLASYSRREFSAFWKSQEDRKRKKVKALQLHAFAKMITPFAQFDTYNDQCKEALTSLTLDEIKQMRFPVTGITGPGHGSTFNVFDFCGDICRLPRQATPKFNARDIERHHLELNKTYICVHTDCKKMSPEFPTIQGLKAHHSVNHTGKFVPHIKCPIPECDHYFKEEGRANRITEHFDEQHSFKPGFICAFSDCNRIFWRKSKAEEHERFHHPEVQEGSCILVIDRLDVLLLFLGEYGWARNLCHQYLQAQPGHHAPTMPQYSSTAPKRRRLKYSDDVASGTAKRPKTKDCGTGLRHSSQIKPEEAGSTSEGEDYESYASEKIPFIRGRYRKGSSDQPDSASLEPDEYCDTELFFYHAAWSALALDRFLDARPSAGTREMRQAVDFPEDFTSPFRFRALDEEIEQALSQQVDSADLRREDPSLSLDIKFRIRHLYKD